MRIVAPLCVLILVACESEPAHSPEPPNVAPSAPAASADPTAPATRPAAGEAPGAVAQPAPGEIVDCAYAAETLPTILVLTPDAVTLGSTALPAVRVQSSPGRNVWNDNLRPVLRRFLLSIGVPKLWLAVDLGPRGFANIAAAQNSIDNARQAALAEAWQPTEVCRFVAEPRIPPPFPRP